MAGVGIIHLAIWLVGDMLVEGKLLVPFDPQSSGVEKGGSAIHAVRMPGRSHAVKAQLFISHLRAVIEKPPFCDRHVTAN